MFAAIFDSLAKSHENKKSNSCYTTAYFPCEGLSQKLLETVKIVDSEQKIKVACRMYMFKHPKRRERTTTAQNLPCRQDEILYFILDFIRYHYMFMYVNKQVCSNVRSVNNIAYITKLYITYNHLLRKTQLFVFILLEDRAFSRRFVRPYVCPSVCPHLVWDITLKLQEVSAKNIVGT